MRPPGPQRREGTLVYRLPGSKQGPTWLRGPAGGDMQWIWHGATGEGARPGGTRGSALLHPPCGTALVKSRLLWPWDRTAGLGNKDRSSELALTSKPTISPSWACVCRSGGMLAPPSPPAKCRRLGLASGSSKSRVVPRSPSRVAAALGSTRAAGDSGVRLATWCAAPRTARFPTRPAGPGDSEVCCGRRAARPWDFTAARPPQRVSP